MKIEFSDIISKKVRKREIDYKFSMKAFNFEGDKITPLEEVTVKGAVISEDQVIIVNLNIKTKLELICSRCLEAFIYKTDIEIEERFTNNEELQTDEVLFVEGESIDITQLVESSIISTLPIKRLCNSECKGLCQSCGSNLNHSTCSCNNTDVDVRLEGLKALLQNKEV